MGVSQAYLLRLRRKRYLTRAWRKSRELRAVADRTDNIRSGDILLFSTLRNERIRLPYFLDYYRNLGVNHFLIVDNASTDGSADYLKNERDVSLWHTRASYKRSRFGVDWLNWLQRTYGHGHWTLVVDPDEFLVYPFCDTRPLPALTDYLERSDVRSFGAMLLDMYPKGPLAAQPYREGQDPFEIASWFDSGNYTMQVNHLYKNLWIQGGPRMRKFFRNNPYFAPALNKTPLVRWHKSYVYVSSTHILLPRGLNVVYETNGGEKCCGLLLHAKFLNTLEGKAREELIRGQHYAKSIEYKAYAAALKKDPQLWCKWSERYINWRQLEILGLMSKGNWA